MYHKLVKSGDSLILHRLCLFSNVVLSKHAACLNTSLHLSASAKATGCPCNLFKPINTSESRNRLWSSISNNLTAGPIQFTSLSFHGIIHIHTCFFQVQRMKGT